MKEYPLLRLPDNRPWYKRSPYSTALHIGAFLALIYTIGYFSADKPVRQHQPSKAIESLLVEIDVRNQIKMGLEEKGLSSRACDLLFDAQALLDKAEKEGDPSKAMSYYMRARDTLAEVNVLDYEYLTATNHQQSQY